MRILFVTETFSPEINGVARTLDVMTKCLRARGHTIILLRPQQASDNNTQQSEHLYLSKSLPIPGYSDLQFGIPSTTLIRHILNTEDISITYIATEGPLGRGALKLCNRYRIPTLSGMHTNFHQYSRHYRLGLMAPLFKRYLRNFHNQCNTTLVPTNRMAEKLTKQGFKNIKVWPRGVNTNIFNPKFRDSLLRQSWGLNKDDLAVIHVGRLASEKNIDVVFKSIKAIKLQHPTAKLILIGDGPSKKKLQEQHPEAIFCGHQTGPALSTHYASGDIFLFPSLTETFGNVVLEAMASGLAVVSYEKAAAAEVIRSSYNGFLAKPNDETHFIEQAMHLANNPDIRKKQQSRAAETVLQHGWPKLISKLEKTMQSMLVSQDEESTAAIELD